MLAAHTGLQHAVEGLTMGIRVRVYAFALLERPQVDDGCDVALDRADAERLLDWNALRVYTILDVS